MLRKIVCALRKNHIWFELMTLTHDRTGKQYLVLKCLKCGTDKIVEIKNA